MNGANDGSKPKNMKMKKGFLHDKKLCTTVFKNLTDSGCCDRCSLRYIGERDPKCYRDIKDTVNTKILTESEQEEPSAKEPRKNDCIACLGLLDDDCLLGNIHKICAEVNEANFDADSFTCAITLPMCMMIRAHSVWLHLLSTFPDTYSKLREEDHVVSIKEVWKWVASVEIAQGVNKTLDSGVTSDFFIGINILYEDDMKDCKCLLKMQKETFMDRRIKRKKYNGELFTRKAVESALQQTTAAHFRCHFPCPPPVPNTSVVYDQVSCSHTSLHMAGRYRKYSRQLSQTPWVVEGEKKMETSVQELICERILPVVRCDSSRFSASGREDVDVRTLGRGRPFVIEFVNPHKVKFCEEEIWQLQQDVNESTSDICIQDLQIVKREELVILKKGEEEKTKRYSALCTSVNKVPVSKLDLDSLTKCPDLVLEQKTPIRVLHRRPLAVRKRSILEMWAEPVSEYDFILHLTTQAGTYIKEFVHGDFGRTVPNLCLMLGAEIDILALDVDEVELDWPKALNRD